MITKFLRRHLVKSYANGSAVRFRRHAGAEGNVVYQMYDERRFASGSKVKTRTRVLNPREAGTSVHPGITRTQRRRPERVGTGEPRVKDQKNVICAVRVVDMIQIGSLTFTVR